METDQSLLEGFENSCFCPCLNGTDKHSIIIELVDQLVVNQFVSDHDGVLAAVLAREAEMSTGMQHGIALPHGKHASVDGLVSVVGVSPVGIDFDALDGQPCSIFVMTVSPPHIVGPHLRFLAAVGKLLGFEHVRESIRVAGDKAEMLSALRGGSF